MNGTSQSTPSGQAQPVQVRGFEHQQIAIQAGGFFGTPKLWYNGQLAPNGPKRGQYLLRRDDGVEVVASFKNSFPDPSPVLVVDGETIRVTPPLEWYELVWSCFPLILIILGGLIGALFGAMAATFNMNLMRSKQPIAVRYGLSALASLAAFFFWILIVTAIRGGR